ncbi:MAG TPA: HlyD family efflux transporter periplasmic adaptor subunit [Candidatus Polarisedimenticolaceae bacterium]|nr:HlyD family efflux transporter periplasmic adaptor subunit [Candidatus Polarisedimenticolaceae bacterium]
MATTKKKSTRIWIVAVIVVAIAAFAGYQYWKSTRSAVPEGIAWGNGRLEAKLVDVAAREPLRVKEILVAEGDLVQPGQVVVRMDTVTLAAELAEANAAVAAAREKIAVASSNIARKKSEIELASIEADRSRKLVEERAGSQRELDVRTTALQTSKAALTGEEAQLQAAQQEVKVAEANGAAIQTRIDDAVLTSPVLGRVLYRLAEPGEVLGPGGKALTIVNLEDVYMEIFLPAREASALKVGAEARLTLDHVPGRAAAAYVSFVSPEAQFTPKEVETRSEREKLMFRVKIQVPKELVSHYVEYVKTGTRGVGYVKVDPGASWPNFLQNDLVRPDQLGAGPTAAR